MSIVKEKTQKIWSRKIYLIPNLFTTANMFCGFVAIIMAIQGRFEASVWLVVVGMFFDSLDGRLARLTRSTSDFGVEYDSMSDLITFGLAPAIISYLWALSSFGRMGWLLAFLYMICAALRLARFNTLVDVVPKGYFQGVPSPCAATTLVTTIVFYQELGFTFPKHYLVIPVLLVTASLMISTFRFPSFKNVKVNRENYFGYFCLLVLVLTLVAIKPEVTFFAIGALYIVIGLAFEVYRLIFAKAEVIESAEQTGI